MSMKTIRFTFDDCPHYDGFTRGETWNGWDVVYVTAETLKKLKADGITIAEDEENEDCAILPTPEEHDGKTLYKLDGATSQVVTVDHWANMVAIDDLNELADFFRWLLAEGISFHPDTSFETYVDENGIRIFSDSDAFRLNHLMRSAFEEIGDDDAIYNLGLRLLRDRIST